MPCGGQRGRTWRLQLQFHAMPMPLFSRAFIWRLCVRYNRSDLVVPAGISGGTRAAHEAIGASMTCRSGAITRVCEVLVRLLQCAVVARGQLMGNQSPRGREDAIPPLCSARVDMAPLRSYLEVIIPAE